jgi:hypothetical protein
MVEDEMESEFPSEESLASNVTDNNASDTPVLH